MFDLDDMVADAANDPCRQETIIRQYKPFILRCASNCSKRYITDSDDEWSIALQAFSEALNGYSRDKGSFRRFAELVIHRRLTDYFRQMQKFRSEIPVSPAVFSGAAEDETEMVGVTQAIRNTLTYEPNHDVADEIEAANAVFHEYGFSFFDLTDVSPKSRKTKEACTKAVVFLLQSPILICELRKTKQLSINIIEKNTGVPRKILERHRKYIIAAVEMLSGEYPCLADYLHPMREELGK